MTTSSSRSAEGSRESVYGAHTYFQWSPCSGRSDPCPRGARTALSSLEAPMALLSRSLHPLSPPLTSSLTLQVLTPGHGVALMSSSVPPSSSGRWGPGTTPHFQLPGSSAPEGTGLEGRPSERPGRLPLTEKQLPPGPDFFV